MEDRQKHVSDTKERIIDGYYIPPKSMEYVEAFDRVETCLRDDFFQINPISKITAYHSLIRDLQGVSFYFFDRNKRDKMKSTLENFLFLDNSLKKNYYDLHVFANEYRAYHEICVGKKSTILKKPVPLSLNGPVSMHLSLVQEYWLSEVGKKAHNIYKEHRSSVHSKLGLSGQIRKRDYDWIKRDFYGNMQRARDRLLVLSKKN